MGGPEVDVDLGCLGSKHGCSLLVPYGFCGEVVGPTEPCFSDVWLMLYCLDSMVVLLVGWGD